MEKIRIKDKYFSVSIPEATIKQRVAEVAAQINEELAGRKPIFLGVLTGSFIFAADLLRNITIDCEIAFIRLASYEGTSSTGNVQQLLGVKEDLRGRTVVVIEDIVDSGLTMDNLLHILEEHEPAEVRIASLFVKPDNLQKDIPVPYCCFRIPNDFIVGYGLDYDGEGRNLPHIYTVVPD